MHLQIINPLEYPNWDELLLTNDQSTFFHTSAWAKVLCESYKYKPLYFTSIDNGKLSALIPFMEIKSFLTGKRGVSLPFTDYCQPIVSGETDSQKNIDELIDYGKKAGWRYIEWRGGERYFQGIKPFMSFNVDTLDIAKNMKNIMSTFRSSTRRNITKAIREEVHVKIEDSLESVKKFYRLHCLTRKFHGAPPQPFNFFRKIYEHIISQKKGFIFLAEYKKNQIAGAVFFSFGQKAIYKFSALDRSYQHLRPSNLVIWEAIRYYAKNGINSLSLGRTEPENNGLVQFKKGWGTEKEKINYYKYDLVKEGFVGDHHRPETYYNFFRKLPSPLLSLAGSLLYKHIG